MPDFIPSVQTVDHPPVVFEPLHDDVGPPERRTGGSAGYDVRAYIHDRLVKLRRGDTGEARTVRCTDNTLVLEPHDIALVPTGFKARLPTGFEAQIRLRSSMAFERGLLIPNAPATIDADYPDEWFVMIKNDAPRPARIAHGERIAQAVLCPYSVLRWTEGTVHATTDRAGGLGSTGTT